MRKVLGILIGLAVLLGAMTPAIAIERKAKSQSLNAFWYSTEQLGPNTFRNTVWYVGAFRYKGGTFSDLYEAVDLCRNTRRGLVCESESFAVGYKELTREEFYIEETRLDSGWIDATYSLQTYDKTGGPTGPGVPTHIRADFTGLGEVERYKDSFVYEDEHRIFKFTFHNFFRLGEAEGWINGAPLGETYDAYLSLSTSTESVRKH